MLSAGLKWIAEPTWPAREISTSMVGSALAPHRSARAESTDQAPGIGNVRWYRFLDTLPARGAHPGACMREPVPERMIAESQLLALSPGPLFLPPTSSLVRFFPYQKRVS